MKKIIPIVSISLLFIASLSILFHRQEERLLANNENRICLNADLNKANFSSVLLQNAYAKTKADANLIAEWLIDSLFINKGLSLSNLGSLNSRDFQIPSSIVENKGGEEFKNRLSLSYKALGCDSVSLHECEMCPTELEQSDSTCVITVFVRDNKKHLFTNGGLEGVHVRLKQHRKAIDSLSLRPIEEDVVVAYSKTNSKGEVKFNVHKDGYYSVLPVKKGFEFGTPQGTTRGKTIGEEKELRSPSFPRNLWQDDHTFTFTQKEHRLRIFDKATYARIKADDIFSVRSVSDYITELVKIASLFLLVWWCTFFFIRWKDKKYIQLDKRSGLDKYQPSDSNIISLLMLLNAICLFMMLAITNPLVDSDYANEMIWGTILGCMGFCLFSSIDYVKYYTGQYVIGFGKLSKWLKKQSWIKQHNLSDKVPENIHVEFDFVSKWLKKRVSAKIPEGIGFLLIALIFVALLGLFGTGPEGSTAKVNLNIGFLFQPSEISKFLFVTAIALFFTANASRINAFGDGKNPKGQFKTLVWVVLAVLLLLSLYVGLISDMGPALVLAVTFIILYSIVRHDLLQMFIGIISYLFVLYLADYLIHIDLIHSLSSNKLAIVLYLSLIWYILWFAGGYFWKKKIYESAGFMNLLILLFTHGGELLNMCGFPNQGQRLMDRIAASGDGIWDNTVRGGDQVAQGIWALSSGGFWGQGLGNGNANLVPAFHTDMIFESIGEVMGFATLFVILVCYAMLIRKCLIRSKESGHPFMFYLIAGIAIVTVVQLFVIVMGSLGIVPLTGVSLPFLSYGKAGLIINLAAFGIILGMSRNKPTSHMKKAIVGFDNVIKSGIVIFSLLFVVVIVYAFNYQVLSRDTYLTRTANITNLTGARIVEQNPRIKILLRNLDAGNIFDRYGRLLATSNTDTLKKYRNSLIDAGVKGEVIDSLSHAIKRRYYPFEDQLFLMLGDMNTRNLSDGVFSDDPYGYLAEERHVDYLRGFSIPTKDSSITMAEVISPFLPSDTICKNTRIPLYEKCDTIIKLLKDGVNGNLVQHMNGKSNSRNITLTIDAVLQTQLQKAMCKNSELLLRPNSRVSLVILDVKNGDLLCSANYPTPNQDSIVSFFNKRNYVFRPSITERDLGLTFQTPPGSTAKVFSAAAGLEKNGTNATKAIYIYKDELIHADNGEEPSGNVTMKEAIVKSSNCFFVNLVHRDRLYNNLAPLYMNTGVKVDRNVPYVFNSDEMTDTIKNTYLNRLVAISDDGYRVYDDYIKRRTSENYYRKMNFDQCGMAWGQGALEASPLSMARLVSIVANGGTYVSTRYIKDSSKKTDKLMEKSNANELAGYMHAEAINHAKHGNPQKRTLLYSKNERLEFGGKTGTPEFAKNKKDGWYVCFFNSNKGKLAMALRIERCSGSGTALLWMDKVIMPTLKEVGYINY